MTRVVNIAQSGGNNVTMRNKIINGDMRIAQRATTYSGIGGSTYQTLDRFVLDTRINASPTGSYTQAQSSDAPAGFNNSMSITVTTAGNSLSSTYALQLCQFVEGYNMADLAWGSASAKPITISFWVKASITGVYSFGVVNAGYDRSYVSNFTVNSASTWEQKTVTIPGCTDGTWNTTTGRGIQLKFSLGSGSSYVTSSPNTWLTAEYEQSSTASASAAFWNTTGATFYITGVQLEAGTTATPFEQRLYGTELALCQRYFITLASGATKDLGVMFAWSATEIGSVIHLPVTMRSTPTLIQTTGTNYYDWERAGGQYLFSGFINIARFSGQALYLYNSSVSGQTGGVAGELMTNNSASFIGLNAEL